MNDKETAAIIYRINANLRSDSRMDETMVKAKVKEWQRMLADLTFEQVNAAMDIHYATSTYEPMIADIRKISADNANGAYPTWEEAYMEISRAISNFGRYRQDEMLANLRPATQQAFLCMGVDSFLNEDIEDGAGTLRAQFRDIYKNVVERKQKYGVLPDRLKGLIDGAGIKTITGGETK
jgi:hypothetical protein